MKLVLRKEEMDGEDEKARSSEVFVLRHQAGSQRALAGSGRGLLYEPER